VTDGSDSAVQPGDRQTDRDQAGVEHARVLDAGEHLLQQLDFRDVEVDGSDLAIELDVDGRVRNPRGALQGGLLATLVDVVAGRAVLLGGPRDGVATADLSIHFLRGLTDGPARAVATVVRRGRRTAVVTVDVLDVGTGSLCAVATVAFSVVPAPTDQRP
jgi:uncharacterized protein (TIGR00369 family)